jgi:gamma-glutamylputrescine oxidase
MFSAPTFMPAEGRAPHVASWYAASAGEIATYPALKGHRRADVAIIGGGYTGLSAALSLAKSGLEVVVLEANKIGWGASGRNGGQIHPGQRQDPDWLCRMVGEAVTRDLLTLADEARSYLDRLITENAIDCDFRPGLIHTVHKPRWVGAEKRHVEHLARKWGIERTFLDKAETAARVGTDVYHAGTFDPKGGKLHPLKFALGLAKAAVAAGATLYEDSRVTTIRHSSKPIVVTADGEVMVDTVIVAGNGYLGGLDEATDARVLPINNFVVATEPLDELLIPGEEAVSDSRFVVYYWHQTPDRRLVFGGGETYSHDFPSDIPAFVRPHLARVYPKLKDVKISHGWGGTLGITFNRMPFIRRPKPNVFIAAGYSGQGVMLAPFVGHVIAEAVGGTMGRFDTFAKVPVLPFPGGALLRWPTLVAAMTWFKLLDSI